MGAPSRVAASMLSGLLRLRRVGTIYGRHECIYQCGNHDPPLASLSFVLVNSCAWQLRQGISQSPRYTAHLSQTHWIRRHLLRGLVCRPDGNGFQGGWVPY